MREKFIIGNIYHILNRGTDKREIFLDDRDRFRFVHDLYEFNDISPANNLNYSFRHSIKYMDIASPYIEKRQKKRNLMVEILSFSLMPNHYHLLLRPSIENGIPLFMKKLNMGYAKYFNERYKRSGVLFEGRYKSINVTSEAHFDYLPYYVHFNPLDLRFPEWRQGKLRDYKKALEFLEFYRWSSHLDYAGIKNFPSITQRNFLLETFGGEREYSRQVISWLKDIDINNLIEEQKLTLE